MLRAVHFGFPARSHTVPGLALIRELVDRGMEVEYYSTDRFQPLIESTGARFVAYPPICERLCDPTDLDGHLQSVVEVAVQIVPELLTASCRNPALVLFDASALWGRIVARQRNAVSVASITTFAFTRSMLQLLGVPGRTDAGPGAQFAETLSRLNHDYAMSFRDYLDVLVAAGDMKVVYTSSFFQPAGRFFDSSHLFVGPLPDRRPSEGVAGKPVGARPLAYVSLGTIFNRDLGLLKRISSILSEAGWQVIVSLGDAGRTVSGEWPPHVQVYPFVDQMATLSLASLFVTHGGMGSVSEALAHGVPMIVVPQGVDQFLAARRTAELGAAVIVESDTASAAEWRTALSHIEAGRATFAAAAFRIGQSFQDVTSIPSAAGRILGLLTAKELHAVHVGE